MEAKLLLPFFFVTFGYATIIFVYSFIDFLNSTSRRETAANRQIIIFLIEVIFFQKKSYSQ